MEHVKTRWISGVENGFQVWELRLLWVRAPGEGKEWGAGWWCHLPRRAQSQLFGFDLCVSEAQAEMRCGPDFPFVLSAPNAPNPPGASLRELTRSSPPQWRRPFLCSPLHTPACESHSVPAKRKPPSAL